ncbi:MAG: GNAT family N-acetyltransferase [Beijerinckiaceae bacterium]
MLFPKPGAQRPELSIGEGGLFIRPPQMSDYEIWAALRDQSRAFLQPWEPMWPLDDLTRGAFRRRLERYARELDRNEAFPFFVFRATDRVLVGGLNLTNVRRGAASMASLGYWMGEPFAGRGVMTAAVRQVTQLAFARLDIRRIEAACLPENAASIRLLEKTGFRREGLAREYLAINGAWRDHLLYARLAGDRP